MVFLEPGLRCGIAGGTGKSTGLGSSHNYQKGSRFKSKQLLMTELCALFGQGRYDVRRTTLDAGPWASLVSQPTRAPPAPCQCCWTESNREGIKAVHRSGPSRVAPGPGSRPSEPQHVVILTRHEQADLRTVGGDPNREHLVPHQVALEPQEHNASWLKRRSPLRRTLVRGPHGHITRVNPTNARRNRRQDTRAIASLRTITPDLFVPQSVGVAHLRPCFAHPDSGPSGEYDESPLERCASKLPQPSQARPRYTGFECT